MEKVMPEDLERKFKSKNDLYDLLSNDLSYHLPPYDKCPIHFLRQVLAGEKKVVKKELVREIIAPRYKELSVYKIWPLIQEADDLLLYFPDYKPNQLPERCFIFKEVSTMIKNARSNRTIGNPENNDRLVHVEKKLYEEIQAVTTNKLTSGRASYLLRRSAKLNTERKKAKEYELMIEDFNKEKEEKKEEDDMN